MIYYSTHARQNEIYLLINSLSYFIESAMAVGLVTKSTINRLLTEGDVCENDPFTMG